PSHIRTKASIFPSIHAVKTRVVIELATLCCRVLRVWCSKATQSRFCCLVHPATPRGRTRTRSWAFRFRRRTDRKSVKLTIGKAGEGGLSLTAVRHAAAAHRHRLERGGDVTSVTPVTPKTEGGWGQDRDGGGRVSRAPCPPQEPRLSCSGHRGHF